MPRCSFDIYADFRYLKVNLSFVLDPNLSFSYEEREIPKVEDSRDIIVRIVSTGVCGSDVSANDRGLTLSAIQHINS